MIKVKFSPQVSTTSIEYSFKGEQLLVRIGDTEDTFDFSVLPDGELDRRCDEDEEIAIKTILPCNPIVSAKRVDGILHLELLNWVGKDAPYGSRFPDWVDLPLPSTILKGSEPRRKAIIPWRSETQIKAERAAREAKNVLRQDRRNRIKNNLLSVQGGGMSNGDLHELLQDMAAELGIID